MVAQTVSRKDVQMVDDWDVGLVVKTALMLAQIGVDVKAEMRVEQTGCWMAVKLVALTGLQMADDWGNQ